jgi:hypothetical protein
MHRHPELGFTAESQDLESPAFYADAQLPFGRAATLPAVAFRSKTFSDLEDEKVWTRQWIAVGTATQIPNAGDMLPYTVGTHGIHVQRLADGGFVGRFNKAQHGGCRFVPLQCQTGTKTRCSYTSCGHSRDRDVIAADELGDGLPTMRHYIGDMPERLLPVRVAARGPLLFVNLDQQAADLGEQLADLPDAVAALLAAPLCDGGGIWVEQRCNWKLAGSAILDRLCPPEAMIAARSEDCGEKTAGHVLTLLVLGDGRSLGLPPLPVAAASEARGTLWWLFPNLVLAILPDHAISIVLQPTSLSSCLMRLRLLVAPAATGAEADRRMAMLLQGWSEAVAAACAPSAERQATLEKWATPSLPGTSAEAMPLEESRHAWRFQRHLVDRLLRRHAYVWSAPLYAAAMR